MALHSVDAVDPATTDGALYGIDHQCGYYGVNTLGSQILVLGLQDD